MENENILYDYVLWNNTYEGMWYAIKRGHFTDFFAGGDWRSSIPKGGYVKDLDLIQLLARIHVKDDVIADILD
jgi:hypothetical protein